MIERLVPCDHRKFTEWYDLETSPDYPRQERLCQDHRLCRYYEQRYDLKRCPAHVVEASCTPPKGVQE